MQLFRGLNRIVVMTSIVVRPENGRLLVLFAYSPERVAKIKTVPGRIWHQEDKRWSVPDEPDMRARLDALFAEESLPPAAAQDSPLEGCAKRCGPASEPAQ